MLCAVFEQKQCTVLYDISTDNLTIDLCREKYLTNVNITSYYNL